MEYSKVPNIGNSLCRLIGVELDYGLGGLGFESQQWQWTFISTKNSRPALEAHPASF